MTDASSDAGSNACNDVCNNVCTNANSTLLLIEDEQGICRFLRAGLHPSGYQIIETSSGREGINLASVHNPTVILLDLGLPDLDGVEVTREIRSWSKVPIIIISARGQESDKIAALDAGADDYITKPFRIGELLARIRAVTRRYAANNASNAKALYTFGPLSIDLSKHMVLVNDIEVHLTPKEFHLLSLLVRYEGCVLTHKQLLTEVWGTAYAKETHYLRVFMKNIRHKIEPDPSRPQYVFSEAGVGYRFKGTSGEEEA